MVKCKWDSAKENCGICNPEGKVTTKTKAFLNLKMTDWVVKPPGEIKIDWQTIADEEVPKKPVFKEPEGGGVLDLPSPEDWVKKHFPEGSTVLGPARDLKGFQSKVFIRYSGLEENIPSGRLGKDWCWACSPGWSHVLPKRQRCPCGCIWSDHYGHMCSKCNTGCYPILTLTGYWVALPGSSIFGTAEGCTCSYCMYRGQIRGPRQAVRPRPWSRPPSKPIEGASNNLGAEDYGLDPKLILVEAAANFYLLVEMGAMQPLTGELDEKFRGITARLADQLCLYLELACLGEFRYTRDYIIGPPAGAEAWFPNNPYSHLGEKEVKVQKRKRLATKHLMKDLRDAVSTIVHGRGSKSGERMAAWSTWKALHEKYGDKIYQLMIYGFREVTWGRTAASTAVSIGGPKWAVCVEAAQAYRKGMPSVVFVDQALSLKHNGNIAFNKFWDVLGLDHVISWAFKGATREIQHYATDDIRKAWQVWEGRREGRGRDEQKQKEQEQAEESD